MARKASDPGGQNAQPPFELIPAPALADSASGGFWPQSSFGGDNGVGSGVGLARYLHALRRRWLMAVLIAFPVSALAACALWLFLPRVYTTTAILRLAANETTLIFETADSNNAAASTFELYKRTQRQLLRSRFVVTRALRDEALAKTPILQSERDPVEWLETNLSVAFPDESEVMHVSLAAGNPEGLSQLVNGVVQAYFDEVVFAERSRKQERLNSLELTRTKVEADLRSKRTELKQLVERIGIGDVNTLTIQQQNSLNQYATVQQYATKSRFELMQAEGELELHEAAVNSPEEDVVSEPELLLAMRTDRKAEQLKTDRQRILDLMQATRGTVKEGAIGGKLDEHSRRLDGIDEKIEGRKRELQKELVEHKRQTDALGIESLKRKVAMLRAQDKQLQSKLHDLELETKQFGKSSIDVEMMRSDIGPLQDTLGRLATELERTRIEQSDSKNAWTRISLLSEAQPARHMDSKGRLGKIVGGSVACLVFTAFFLIWLDARKERINSGTDIIQELGLPVIGAVPLVPNRVMRRLNGSSAKQKYWRTLLSESVDSIAAVLHRGARKGRLGVVMVSSATAGEGKTTLAANLATSLAGAGCRTVLVDFDLRRPALHLVFELSLQPGINDALRDPANFESAIQLTQIPNLTFLAAGRWNTTGLSGLATTDLNSLFERLRSEFEFVVVDGSPILPVVDTRLIAQHVDTVVLSVLRDVSRVAQVRAAGRLLESFAIPILGVVITGSRGDAYPNSTYQLYEQAAAV